MSKVAHFSTPFVKGRTLFIPISKKRVTSCEEEEEEEEGGGGGGGGGGGRENTDVYVSLHFIHQLLIDICIQNICFLSTNNVRKIHDPIRQ